MDKFIIDRQFGLAIWVDVEDGIVLRCYNEEPKFIEKMNEKYVGKSITFLNKDFIYRAMKGTYHHLRPESTYVFKNKIQSLETRIRHLWNEYSSHGVTKERQAEIKGQIKELEKQETEANQTLTMEKVRILTDHKFVVT